MYVYKQVLYYMQHCAISCEALKYCLKISPDVISGLTRPHALDFKQLQWSAGHRVLAAVMNIVLVQFGRACLPVHTYLTRCPVPYMLIHP